MGHLDRHGHFQNAQIPIAHGTEVISGRSLVNDRAICPNAAFPNTEIHERAPDTEKMRTAPLWGVRSRPRLMHDGSSWTPRDAIPRHSGEAADESRKFDRLSKQDQEALIEFLRCL